MQWLPHTTVATIVEQDGRLLMVEELEQDKSVFNQPAGHLEDNESLPEAAVRETLEETGWHIELTGFLGVYHYRTDKDVTYIRHCFIARPLYREENPQLDEGIIAAHWMSREAIAASDFPARSVAVKQVLADYDRRKPLPLDTIYFEQT